MNKVEMAITSQPRVGAGKTILFCGQSSEHFPYYATTIAALLELGHSVHYIVDESRSKDVRLAQLLTEFASAHPSFRVGAMLRRPVAVRYPIMWCRELGAVASYLSRPLQSAYYVGRARRYLPPGTRWVTKVSPTKRWLASPTIRRMLAGTERFIPVNRAVRRHIAELRPDVVVCSPANMHASLDLEYLKAAKSLGIATVLPVLSWDNLSTKGLIHVEPDLLLAWNSAHADEATSIHRIDPRKVVVTGSPFFDKWFDANLRQVTPRAEFLQRVGLDAGRPYLLYLGSSVHIAPDERWIVERIAECFAQSSDPALRAMQIVLRPHPANLDRYRDFARKDVAVWPRRELLPADRDSQRDFLDSVRHSVLCVGINTTGMIDAIIDDRPVAALLLDQYHPTQVQTQHFQHLMAARCLHELDAVEALPALVKRLAGGEDADIRRRRADFIVDFIRPHGLDKPAGALAAWCIDQLAQGAAAEMIQQRLPHVLAPPMGASV